ncbi:MAG: hypothetical protein ACRD36_00400 [Candidatus Acidiferrum sp.]
MNGIMRLLLFSFAVLMVAVPRASAQSKAENPAGVKSLEFFNGDWHCDGKFSNGKEISARLRFELVLDGKFILFKHDDEPPFSYHAHAYWGWDQAAGQFVATVHDSTGGTRLFRSSGWQGTTLNWLGGDLPASANQRFTFERLKEKKFVVSYSYLKNDSWVSVDSSVCTATSK